MLSLETGHSPEMRLDLYEPRVGGDSRSAKSRASTFKSSVVRTLSMTGLLHQGVESGQRQVANCLSGEVERDSATAPTAARTGNRGMGI